MTDDTLPQSDPTSSAGADSLQSGVSSSLSTPPASRVDRERQKSLRSLRNLINLSQGHFSFALIEYDLPRQRDELLTILHQALPALNQVTVTLAPLPTDEVAGVSVLDVLVKQVQAISPRRPPDFLTILGFDTLLGLPTDIPEESNRKRIAAIQPFNLGRNILAQNHPYPVLLIMPRWAMHVFVSTAPDVNSWRSGFYSFTSDLPQVAAELKEAAQEVGIGPQTLPALQKLSEEALQERKNRQDALIQDAEAALSDPYIQRELAVTPELLARLYQNLGWLCLALRQDQARKAFGAMQKWAEEANIPSLLSAAKQGLDVVEQSNAGKLRPKHTGLSQNETDLSQRLPGASVITDREHLYGREADLDALTKRFTSLRIRFLTLWGGEGCGKSSLVRAGLIPNLDPDEYLTIYMDRWDFDAQNPGTGDVEHVKAALGAILQKESPETFSALDSEATLVKMLRSVNASTKKTIVLVFDQFDQFFLERTQRSERQPFLRAIGACYRSTVPCKFLFVVRDRRLGYLAEFGEIGRDSVEEPLSEAKRFYLPSFDTADARNFLRDFFQSLSRPESRGDVSENPASSKEGETLTWEKTGSQTLDLEEDLPAAIINDIKNEGRVRPLDLQLVAAVLAFTNIHTLAEYASFGGAAALRDSYLMLVLEQLSQKPRLTAQYRHLLTSFLSIRLRLQILTLSIKEIAEATQLSEARVQEMIVSLEEWHLVQKREPLPGITTAHLSTSAAPRYTLITDLLAEQVIALQDERRMAEYLLHRALKANRRFLSYTALRKVKRLVSKEERERPQVRAILLRSRVIYNMCALLTTCMALFFTYRFTLDNMSYFAIDPNTERMVIRPGLPFYPSSLQSTDYVDTGFVASNFHQSGLSIQGWTSWTRYSDGRMMADPRFQSAFYGDPGIILGLKLKNNTISPKQITTRQFNMDENLIEDASFIYPDWNPKLYDGIKKLIMTNLNEASPLQGAFWIPLGWMGLEDKNIAQRAYEELVMNSHNPTYLKNGEDRFELSCELALSNESAARSALQTSMDQWRTHNQADVLFWFRMEKEYQPLFRKAWTSSANRRLQTYFQNIFYPITDGINHPRTNLGAEDETVGQFIANLPDSYSYALIDTLFDTLQKGNKDNVQTRVNILHAAAKENYKLADRIYPEFFRRLSQHLSVPVSSAETELQAALCRAVGETTFADSTLTKNVFKTLNTMLQKRNSDNSDAIIEALGSFGEGNPAFAAIASEAIESKLLQLPPEHNIIAYIALAHLSGNLQARDSHTNTKALLNRFSQWEDDQKKRDLDTSSSNIINKIRIKIYHSICSMIKTDDAALKMAIDLEQEIEQTSYRDPMAQLGDALAVQAKTQNPQDPDDFLLEKLRGEPSPFTSISSINSFYYRCALVRALAVRLTATSSTSELDKIKIERLDQALQKMCAADSDTPSYLRIAAWDARLTAFRLKHGYPVWPDSP